VIAYSGCSDEQLIVIVQTCKELSAFNELLTRHHQRLRDFLIKLAAGDNGVDDVMQETLVKAFIRIDSFKGNAQFSTWLFSIGYNEYLQAQRKKGVFRKLQLNLQQLFHRHEPQGIEIELSIDLQTALKKLTSKERAVLIFCDAMGYSHSEAAAALDMPLGSIKTTIKRARSQAGRLLTGQQQNGLAEDVEKVEQ